MELARVMGALGASRSRRRRGPARHRRSETSRRQSGARSRPGDARCPDDEPSSGVAGGRKQERPDATRVEILRLISTGLNSQAIAERLFISEHTVHRHVANTLAKLNVSSRSAAVAQAAHLGLL